MRRWILPTLLLLGVILVAFSGNNIWSRLTDYIETSGVRGMAIFFLAFVSLTTFCFPVSVLGISAGAMFGFGKGLLLLLGSGMAAGLLMFIVGRFIFRGPVLRWTEKRPRLSRLNRIAEDRALRLNFLARLSPLNYGVVCYTLAAGKSPFQAYLLGLLAIVPGMAAQAWVGQMTRTAGDALQGGGRSPLDWALLGGGLLFLILLSWQVGRMFREAWQDMDDDRSEDVAKEVGKEDQIRGSS